jgi:hypothetical protein
MKIKQYNNIIDYLLLSGYRINAYERNLIAEVLEVLELQNSKYIKNGKQK